MPVFPPRRREITRLEGFSDAVFGFALTLLVVSLEVPSSYRELVATMQGFGAFACCFAIVAWIWYEHNLFFRRYGLQDGITISLNFVLLFVVLFYVYPLKFIFSALINGLLGLGPGPSDVRFGGSAVMLIYSSALVLLFLIFTLLYYYAIRQRHALQLDKVELYDANTGMLRHSLTVAIGLLSISIALFLPTQVQWAGLIYFLLGPAHGLLGYVRGSRRENITLEK